MAQSLVERLEFTAKTSQDPVDAQALRDAAEAIELCIRSLSFYQCGCSRPCTEDQYKDSPCGMRAKRTIKALNDGRTRL